MWDNLKWLERHLFFLAQAQHHPASKHPNQSWELWLTLPSPARLPCASFPLTPGCQCPRAGPCLLSPHCYSPLLTAFRHAIYSVQRTHVALLLKPSQFPSLPEKIQSCQHSIQCLSGILSVGSPLTPESYSPAFPSWTTFLSLDYLAPSIFLVLLSAKWGPPLPLFRCICPIWHLLMFIPWQATAHPCPTFPKALATGSQCWLPESIAS